MSVNTWWQYVGEVTQHATLEAVARKVNVSQATVSRWQGSTPKPQNVADFARAYGRPVLEAFVAAGFLDASEAKERPTERHPITSYSSKELVEEVGRRLGLEEDETDARSAEAGKKTRRAAPLPARDVDEDAVPIQGAVKGRRQPQR